MKTIELKPKAKILVIQLRRIGDVLLTTPVLRALRRQFSGAQIDFLVEKPGAEILAANPYINNLLVYDKKEQLRWIRRIRAAKYDVILDFLGNPRTAWIVGLSGAKYRLGFKRPGRDFVYTEKITPDPVPKYVPAFKLDLLKPLGLENKDVDLDLQISASAQERINSFLAKEKIKETDTLIGISPTSRRQARRWLKRGFAESADLLMQKYGAKVIFLWGPGEETYIDDIINLMQNSPLKSPALTITESVALTSKLTLFMGNDNGPMHIAQGLKIPTVVIFGPTQSANWSEPDPRNIVVKAEVPCLECNKQECAGRCCMARVTVLMVEEAIKKSGVFMIPGRSSVRINCSPERK
ncbi:MAG: glycosyltransferase family 9 protein [Elusimicrobia bacterium]|nr:glycosyltransferase family 9 protein [Elusimicrobiota bacterium]